MTIHSKLLFTAAVLGGMFELFEVIFTDCTLWQQDFLLLGILVLLALVMSGHEILMTLSAGIVLVFYGIEVYEQVAIGQACTPLEPNDLKLLLVAALLAAAGLALGHQLNGEESTKK